MKIILTISFHKNLKKLWYSEVSLLKEVSKYIDGEHFYKLGYLDWIEICKGYIDSKKKRLVFLFRFGNYIVPIKLLKKESKLWWNIHKDTLIQDFSESIDKTLEEIKQQEIYKKIDL